VRTPYFIDTNVFLYSWDASAPAKQDRATAWLRRVVEEQAGRTSLQVLAEFYVNAVQKLRPPLPRAEAREFAAQLFTWDPVAIDAAVLEAAWRVQERSQLGWWDALIVAAAQRARCRTLLSEDLQAGQDFDGVVVVNPFATAP
jgi:predicted nucleic acid-binding protein